MYQLVLVPVQRSGTAGAGGTAGGEGGPGEAAAGCGPGYPSILPPGGNCGPIAHCARHHCRQVPSQVGLSGPPTSVPKLCSSQEIRAFIYNSSEHTFSVTAELSVMLAADGQGEGE